MLAKLRATYCGTRCVVLNISADIKGNLTVVVWHGNQRPVPGISLVITPLFVNLVTQCMSR